MAFYDPISRLFKAFSRKRQDIEISKLSTGALVELKYRHPREMGFLSDNVTCTRLNGDELENRVIKGSITSVYRQPGILKWFVGIKCYKRNVNNHEENYERHYLFIEDEIEYIRELN